MNRCRDDRGGAALLLPFLAVFGGILLYGTAQIGSAVIAKARAETAADAAALAAAEELALGARADDAVRAAADSAALNGAVLDTCDCSGSAAEVRVHLDAPPLVALVTESITAGARAEVEFFSLGWSSGESSS